MNCMDWEERIALHAGGDLDAGEAAAVERHLSDCPGCQVFWSGLKETLGKLREMHEEGLGPADYAAVRARVMAEVERGRRVWRRLAWVSGVGIAAMVLLGVAVRAKLQSPLPPPPSRMALRIPEAPLVREQHATSARPKAAGRAPLVVKLQTADPNIVIYWIGEY
ncbi:MAG TPA: zf-HC2 domain-containing protein [Candidatus Acidoferrales bacterium]|nr:zf-HC2 domain-containing protein [Candidatus Acidoferrales bacterium]